MAAVDKKASELTAPVSIAGTDVIAGYRPGTGGEPNLDIRMTVDLIRDQVPAAGVVTEADAPTGRISRTQAAKNSDQFWVKDFGAIGDGVTDDRAAIQTALNTVIPTGKTLRFSEGIYAIAGQANWPAGRGAQLVGAGSVSTKIKQLTDNVPILSLPDINGSDACAYISIRDIGFTYANLQSAANTSAVCIKGGTLGTYNSSFDRLHFSNGYRGIQGTGSANGYWWGCTFENLTFDVTMTGAWIALLASGGGQPNNTVGPGVFGRAEGATEDLMQFIGCDSLNILGVEVNNIKGPVTVGAISISSSSSASVLGFRAEWVVPTGANKYLIKVTGSSDFCAKQILLQKLDCANLAAGEYRIFSDDGGSGSKINCDLFIAKGTLNPTSGFPTIFYANTANPDLYLGEWRVDHANYCLVSSSTPLARDRLDFASGRRPITTVDPGSITLTHEGPSEYIYATPLTGTITVGQPSSSARGFGTKKWMIVRAAGCTGAFNINIGTGPLVALTAEKQWVIIARRGSNTFYLSSYGTLP